MKFEKKAGQFISQEPKKGFLKRTLSKLKVKRNSGSHLYYLLHIKPKIRKFLSLFTFLERAPKGVLFVLALLFMGSVLVVNQHFMRQYWFNTVVEQYPDLTKSGTDEEGKMTLSPIDKIFTPITASNQAFWLIVLVITLNLMLGEVWLGWNVRKPQTLPSVKRGR